MNGTEGICRMVTTNTRTIDFSTFPDSDGEPVAENRSNMDQMTTLIYAAERYLAPRVRFAAGGNQFIYYDRHDGRHHVAPDVYIALDVAPGIREKWQTWLEGDKFPDIVFEVTSESTQDEDLVGKVRLYARLGAHEYYIYDPAQELQPPLRAYHRVGSRLVEQALLPGQAIYSPLLGTELRVVGRWLRLIDPQTGESIPTAEEEHDALLEERAALLEERARAEMAEHAALSSATRAETAERALREALAELARLRGQAREG
jgi:Uma2 family endonuclease